MTKKLYRKVNSKAFNCQHNTGIDASSLRTTKEGMSKKMTKKKRGLDYTPLYRFLLSKIGQPMDKVYAEACSKVLDKTKIVLLFNIEDFVRVGENSYYSALYIDENNLIQKQNPTLTVEDFYPCCPCCTHTFNGKPFVKKYEYGKYLLNY